MSNNLPTHAGEETEDVEQEQEENSEGSAEETEEVEQDDDRPLGPAGEKALNAEKEKRRTEAARRRAAERERDELKAEAERLRKAAERAKPKPDQPDTAVDAEEIRRQAEADATAKANARVLRAELRAAATGKLADPNDALQFLNLDQFEVGDEGVADAGELADAIDDLLTRKPYLAASSNPAKRFQGGADGGKRGRTTEKTLDQQIRDAEQAGDMGLAITLKNQKLLAGS